MLNFLELDKFFEPFHFLLFLNFVVIDLKKIAVAEAQLDSIEELYK